MSAHCAVDLARFAAVGEALIANPDHPGAMSARKTCVQLGRENPTRVRCEVALLATEHARVAAMINPRLTDEAGAPHGLLGFFESTPRRDAARFVLDDACDWLRARGCATARGPIDFSTWHNYRFTTRVHAPGWLPGEPFHPDYYPALWTELGFRPIAHYASSWAGDPVEVGELFRRKAQPAVDAGYTIRTIATDGSDLGVLFGLASEGFSRAFMFSPIDRDEFAVLYGRDRARAIGPTSYIVHSEAGDPAGFLAGYRVPYDQHGAVGILKTAIVDRDHRGTGVYHMLFGSFIRDSHAAGCGRIIAALMHMDGEPAKMGWHHRGTLTKEYALYERPL